MYFIRTFFLCVSGGVSSVGAGIEFILSKQAKTLMDQVELLVEDGATVELYMARVADGEARFDTLVDTRNAAA